MQRPVKALLIDHDDSFTENVRSWLNTKTQVDVVHHSHLHKVTTSDYGLIVISPGPKSPADYPATQLFIKQLPTTVPVLGICLGLQMMYFIEGASITAYQPPLHGKTTALTCQIPEFNQTAVARYHSLRVPSNHPQFLVRAHCEEIPMWCEHKNKKWMGFQFHPESFLTQKADLFLDYVLRWSYAE